MGNRGLRASNRRPFSEPFRQAEKRKASEAQRVRIWARHTFSGEYDKHAVYPFIGIFLITLVLAGVVLAGSPLFHSKVPYPITPNKLPSSGDPQQFLWQATSPNTDTTEFTSVKAVEATLTVNGYNTKALKLTANSTQTAVAISGNPTADLGIVDGKNLLIGFSWAAPSGLTTAVPFGMFLTTNSTVNNTNGAYDPSADSSVVLLMKNFQFSANNFQGTLFIQREIGVTIATENNGGGCSPASSCYMVGTYTSPSINPVADLIQEQLSLNFTGASPGAQSCIGTTGNACSSWLTNDFQTTNQIVRTSVQFPWLSLVGQLHVGFYVQAGMANPVSFTFNLSNGSMSVQTFTFAPGACTASNPCPQTQGPTIDTGGFFGPIIRALISIGFFMAKNIITFAAFLYGLLATMLVVAASLVGAVLIAVMNTLGGIFSDPTLGSQINTAFSNIVSYLTNVFAGAVAIWANILTALLNMLNFVVQFLTITVNGGSTLFSFIESFFLTMQNFWTVFVGVWNQFMKYYIAGTFTIQYILVGWWIWGMYENFSHLHEGIQEGIIDSWLQPSATLLLGMFKAGYYFLDEAYKFVVQLKQLIFGNRIAPGTIAGNG